MNYSIIYKDNDESLEIRNVLLEKIELDYCEKNPNIVIVVGGDGTVLRAIHQYSETIDSVVFFTIHTGTLGYYANYSPINVDYLVEQINSNNYTCKTNCLLDYTLKTKKNTYVGIALNEVTIINSPMILSLNVLVDGFHFETFRGSGLCVSTPSGSSAYNMSLGGAVVDCELECFELTEIAGINSNVYRTLRSPIVFSKSRKLGFKAFDNYKAIFTYDNFSLEIDDLVSIEVYLSGKRVKFALYEPVNYFKRLKKTFL